MADEYELKQVEVRLKLAEVKPLYSTESITTPDRAVSVMAQALAQMDREYCCVVNLDGASHPINFNVVSIGDVNSAQVPIQNMFKSAILSNAAGIMMFHNHPSGSTRASREDVEVTKRLIEAGKLMNIPVIDHIIVAGGTADYFSFRENNPGMFAAREEAGHSVHEPQTGLDPDKLMVRPTYGRFGVYEITGENRARVLFEGTQQECYQKIDELRERMMTANIKDRFTIYQLKDDESLRHIRFKGLDWMENEGRTADKDNYNIVYDAPLKPGITLDDLYFQFNMQHPLDFRGHSLSVSDVVVLHQDNEDKAFYVDRFGFSELPDFLLERAGQERMESMENAGGTGYEDIQAASLTQEIVKNFRSDTERLFKSEKLDGMKPADIEDAVRAQVQQMIDDYGLDAKIEDVIVSGSRCRGLESEESDLDVVVSFSGTEREDDFFNLLHDEKMYFGSVELDINPINTEQTGALAEYLPRVEKYLSEKSIAIDRSFKEPALAIMEKYGYELVAEQDKEHDFTLIRPEGGKEASGFDGWQMVHDYFKDVDGLVEQHSIPELRSMLDGEVPLGISDEQLRAAIRYKENHAISREAAQGKGQTVETLAAEIDRLSYEYDPVKYNDMVKDRAAQAERIASDIRSGNTGYINEFLKALVSDSLREGMTDMAGRGMEPDDSAGIQMMRRAKELLDQLTEYKPLAKVEELVEENYNQIDNQLSNLPPDPKERKEPKQEKTQRQEEHKKARRRVSMKEKLAEKKAETAEQSADKKLHEKPNQRGLY